MITKNDLILLLTDMQSMGKDVSALMRRAVVSQDIPLDVIKAINDSRQLDVAAFYDGLRKRHNQKKSNLYANIVREDSDPKEAVVTLAAFNLQALLYAKKLDDPKAFMRHSRLDEVAKCLSGYYNNYDLIPCVTLLKLIKADLKAFESIR